MVTAVLKTHCFQQAFGSP